jgi:hypothetical protein
LTCSVNFFCATEIRKTPEKLETVNKTETGFYLGKLSTSDDYEIGLFYYRCENRVIRRRVGLRSLVKLFTKHLFDAVLVVFEDGTNWRSRP